MLIFLAGGRIGNQIFQYVFLKTIQDNNEKIIVSGFEELKEVFEINDFINLNKDNRWIRFFLFRISSQIWRFSQKLRFSFLKGFQAKKGLVLHVLCPSHPCASLARTVLKPLSFLACTL